MIQFRWVSKALTGAWCRTQNDALFDAVGHGQAFLNSGAGHIITLRPYASIEQRPYAAV